MPQNRFIVRSSCAKMPANCRGNYRKVAVMEMESNAGFPKAIDTRAKGCVRIVRVWTPCNVGGPRSAYGKALAAAHAMADSLNGDPAGTSRGDGTTAQPSNRESV